MIKNKINKKTYVKIFMPVSMWEISFKQTCITKTEDAAKFFDGSSEWKRQRNSWQLYFTATAELACFEELFSNSLAIENKEFTNYTSDLCLKYNDKCQEITFQFFVNQMRTIEYKKIFNETNEN